MLRFTVLLLAAACIAAQPPSNGLYATFHTSMGNFRTRLYEKETPLTVANFVALAQGKKATRSPKTGKLVARPLYDNITFHRVVSGEMIQSGDPTGTGSHNCGFTIPDEYLPGLRFDSVGKLAMANTGDPNSGGCQFFLTVGPMPSWSGKYAIFGVVVEGQDVVSRINHARVHGDRPVDPVKLITVTIERVGPEPVKKARR
ncbi:MAG TPA: peptidylprolyl isomerase [Candidatus Acidoferrum sp.]|nr:peptidylprolyl isomerase [Candidatus Acidoferrum sp.]